MAADTIFLVAVSDEQRLVDLTGHMYIFSVPCIPSNLYYTPGHCSL